MKPTDLNTGGNNVLIEPIYNDYIKLDGDNKIIIVDDGATGRNLACTGYVRQVPQKLYYDDIDMLYHTEMELQLGDLVVFNSVSTLVAEQDGDWIIIEGVKHYLVPYYQIYAAKRKIITGELASRYAPITSMERGQIFNWKAFPLQPYAIFPLNGILICENIVEDKTEFESSKVNTQKAKVLITGSCNTNYRHGDPDDEDNISPGDTILLDKFSNLPTEYWDTFFDKPTLRVPRNLVTGIIKN